jgi:drug/metabolite transporter, DME family
MSRLLVLSAAVLFGTTGTAQALGPGASPLAVGAARIAVGAALLALVAALMAPRAARSSRGWSRRWLAVAAAGIAGYQLAFFAAVADTGVAVGTVVAIGSAPALAGLFARAVDGTALNGRWAACTAMATAGVLLLVLSGSEARVSIAGVLMALIAGASYAVYTVASKRLLGDGHAPEAVMARGFGLAAIVLAPVLLVAGAGPLSSAGGITLVVYLGAIPTALAYVLFARGLRKLSAGETATLTLAEPLTATALGTLVLAERPGLVAAAGAALVLGGLAALALPARRQGRGGASQARPTAALAAAEART